MNELMTKTNFRGVYVTFFITLALFWLPTVSPAGEYHNPMQNTYSKATETLTCSQCHTMHGTQGGQSMIYGGASPAAGGYIKLLRAANIVQLCRTCHENNSLGMSNPTPPDVWKNTLGYIASAGDFDDRNILNEANRHSVGSNNLTPPGSNPTITIPYFSCTDCHEPHGNSNYRNLKMKPGNATSKIVVNYRLNGTGDCSDGTVSPCDVDNTTTTGQGSTANLFKYNRDNVSFTRAASDNNGIAAWCGGCHTTFHGAGGAYNMGGTVSGDTGSSPWVRHPARDVSINAGNTDMLIDRSNWAGIPSSARTRVINPDGLDPTSSVADEQVFCLSCHYAHGGGNPNFATDPILDHSNLVMIDGAGRINIDPAYDATAGSMRNTCQQCHNQ